MDGERLVHFLFLLGQMHVHRPAGHQRRCPCEIVNPDRAQRMRRDAHLGVGRQTVHRRGCAGKQALEAVAVTSKAQLAAGERTAVDAAMAIVDGQKRQADTGRRRGRGDARRKLAGIVISGAARLVMQVVELGNGGEAGLEHFHEREGSNRLNLVRRQDVEEAVHDRTPGPEAVAPGRSAPLGKAGHRALEGVAVQVRDRR